MKTILTIFVATFILSHGLTNLHFGSHLENILVFHKRDMTELLDPLWPMMA